MQSRAHMAGERDDRGYRFYIRLVIVCNDRFGRYFRTGQGLPKKGCRARPITFVPQIASYVDGDSLCIRADLPGVDPQEVELIVENNQLTLKGERKAEQEQQNGNRLTQEVQYGAFARTFTLPEGVTAEGLQACYHNGVLKVPIHIKGEEPQAIAS